MPGKCTFKRDGQEWLKVDDCVGGGKECPKIPVKNGPQPDTKKFLDAFQEILGSNFMFENDDILTLVCDQTQTDDANLLLRDGKELLKFKLSNNPWKLEKKL